MEEMYAKDILNAIGDQSVAKVSISQGYDLFAEEKMGG